MIYLKQSTASQEVLLGPFVDSADGVTAKTALTIANTDIKIWVAGATTLANKNSGGATHISNGNYYAVLDATDTATLGSAAIVVQVSGALAVRHDICILAANVYDSLIGGGDVLDVNTTQVSGTAQTARDVGGALPAAAPGASGGLVRVGSNSAAISFTAGMTISNTGGNALSLSSSGGNGHGLSAAGNGSGDGISAIGGATGHGMQLIGGLTSGDGLHTHGMGTGHGILAEAHGTGTGISAAITSTITGSLSGSVGSVSGAVGSVTGNVGGNVTGSVGSVTGLTASDVAAIKAKTDSLTFTVAGQVDANTQSINDVTITGDGQVGTEFGV